MADELVKLAPDLEICITNNIKLPCTDYKPKIKQFVPSQWQKSWSEQTENKLYEIQPKLQPKTYTAHKNRQCKIHSS